MTTAQFPSSTKAIQYQTGATEMLLKIKTIITACRGNKSSGYMERRENIQLEVNPSVLWKVKLGLNKR